MVSVQYTCDSDPSRSWRYTVVDGAFMIATRPLGGGAAANAGILRARIERETMDFSVLFITELSF
jgi:hypothetical protein